jgi:protein TonB
MSFSNYARPRLEWHTLAGIVVLHGLLVFVMLRSAPVAPTLMLERPLVVSLIEAPRPEPVVEPPPPPPPPAPVPPVPRTVTPPAPPILTAPAPTPQEADIPVVPEPLEPPTPVVEPIPEPAPVPVPVPSVAPAPAPRTPAAVVVPTPPAVQPPRFDADYLRNPAPSYPSLSRRLGEQGQVLLRVYVEPDGNASRVELKASSGYPRLDSAAMTAVHKWRFVPARLGDTATGAWVVVPISFSVRS